MIFDWNPYTVKDITLWASPLSVLYSILGAPLLYQKLNPIDNNAPSAEHTWYFINSMPFHLLTLAVCGISMKLGVDASTEVKVIEETQRRMNIPKIAASISLSDHEELKQRISQSLSHCFEAYKRIGSPKITINPTGEHQYNQLVISDTNSPEATITLSLGDHIDFQNYPWQKSHVESAGASLCEIFQRPYVEQTGIHFGLEPVPLDYKHNGIGYPEPAAA